MDPERWAHINHLFEDALARDDHDRHAWLVEACGADETLREAVERLLLAHERPAGFLDVPVAANAGKLLSPRDPPTAVVEYFSHFQVGSEFRGTERFTVRRRLGAGGMGVVYEAHDRLRDEVVALKTLLHASASDIYRLKREFRSLADIAHPNLVCLYELFVEAGTCFFTMELVHGVRISDLARGMDAGEPERLRRAVRQLVAGLLELHRKGKLHRDIKPSNVLVTADDQVVILDFGLTSDVMSERGADEDRQAGTPAYLAPEQHLGASASEATDWYSVGVTLYEALTGTLPFTGSAHELGIRKARDRPLPPTGIDAQVPDDLSELCLALLNPDPAQRLSGHAVLERLAAATAAPHESAGPARPRDRPAFVGRRRERDILQEAIAALDERRPGAVCVHGPSGIGKTALVQHVLDGAASRGALVLRGRCYEHEFVPFKALDGIVDSLSAYVSSLPSELAAELLPPDVAALARAFPVMLQVKAVARAHRRNTDAWDPSAQRRAAFSALRALLTTIAERRALLIHIDDLHWADQDSAQLLDDLLTPPAPPLLMLVCVRAEEIAAKPYLQAWLDGTGAARARPVRLEPMSEEEARDVIAALLPAAASLGQGTRLDIAREARGNPFLLEQLAYHVAGDRARLEHEATLAEMLHRRCERLAVGARRFLEVLALCGRPMAPEVVHEAAGLEGDERRLVAMLRADHLLRNSGSALLVEPYHDRIRETLADRLASDDARAIHRALVRILTARGVDDPDALFEHCRGAGDREAASHHAAAAARKARAALAFDRAASLYRSALDLAPASSAVMEWTEALAEALTSAGRPREAAEVYLDASRGADRSKQVELRRRAAEQFLAGGHIDRGTAVIGTVLGAVNMRLASSPLAAVAALLWRRARLRWRGLDYVERKPGEVAPETLLRIDTCWSVVTGLALVDIVRAAEFNTRHLALALDAGEPYRLARALTLEAGFLGSDRTQARYAAVCFERAAGIARHTGHPHAEAMLALQLGSTALLAGEWKTATAHCRRALSILRERCAGVTWEINYTETLYLGSLLFQGEIREVASRVPALLQEARDRGNLAFETELRTRMNVVWLVADQPDEGERQANEAMDAWSHAGFHRQHYNHVLARIQTELYRGDAEAAWELVASRWQGLERTLLLRVQFLEIEARYLHARAALLMAANGRDVRRFVSIALADARRIGRFGMRWSDPIARLLTSAVAHLGGRDHEAEEQLAAAIAGFERADMRYHAAVGRRRLGQLQGGERGHELIREAEEWMADQNIVNATRISRLIAPGFPDLVLRPR